MYVNIITYTDKGKEILLDKSCIDFFGCRTKMVTIKTNNCGSFRDYIYNIYNKMLVLSLFF